MSGIRKLAMVVAAVCLLLAGAAAYFVLTFDANRYRGLILSQLSRSVNRPVEAADLTLQWFPLRLRLNQVRIPEDPGFTGEEFLRAQAVQFDFSLWSLLSGHPQVVALELDHATIYLRPDKTGRWNVSTLATATEEKRTAEAPVRNWILREGTLVIEPRDRQPLRLTGVELAITGLSTARPFPFELAVNFSPESRVRAQGRLGPLNLEELVRTPLEADVTLEKFRPAALSGLVEIPAALARLHTLDGTLNLNATVTETTVAGRLNLLGGGAEEEDVSVELTASATPGFQQVKLRQAALASAGARVDLSGSLDLSAEPAGFDLVLATSNADIAELKQIPARLGVPLPESLASVSGALTAALKLAGTIDVWWVTGTAEIRELVYPLAGLPQPLRIPSLELTFEPDRVVAAPFTVSPQPGLSLNIAGSVENYRQEPRLQAQVTGAEMPLEPVLALLSTLGKNPLGNDQKLSGRVEPRLSFSGPLAEPAKLGYEGTLALSNLSLSTPQLPEPVRVPAVQLSLTPARISATPFTALIGQQLEARSSFRLDNYQTNPSLSAQLATSEASLGALLSLARTLGSDPLPGGRADGRVTATIEVSGPLGEASAPLAVQGQAQMANASVQPAELSEPVRVERATLRFSRDRFDLSDLQLVAAGTTVQGSLQASNFDAPSVRFNLRGGTLDLERLQALFAAPPQQAPRAAFGISVVHAQGEKNRWFARLRAQGRLDFDQLRHGSLTLAPFAAPVAIEKQVVTCNPIEFGLYDGGGRGRLTLDLRGAEPVTEFDGLLRGVDANKLLSANSDSKDRLYGRLGGNLTVRFVGSERQRVTQSATGNGRLSLVNGRLGQLNLSRELVVLGQLTGLRYEQRDTPIEDMLSDFEIGDGWVRTEELTLRTPDLSMTAVGGFSLKDELAFEATAVFTQEASQRLSSRNPLGNLTGQVLSDDQGRIVIPFLIRGTFAQPKFTLDAKRLLEMRLRRGRTGPGGTLKDILDRLRKPPEPPQP